MQLSIHEIEIVPKQRVQPNAIWLYSNQIKHIPESLLDENKCALVYSKQLNKIGIYCKKSLIAVKFLNFLQYRADKIEKEEIIQSILKHLQNLRAFKAQFPFINDKTFNEELCESYRLCHGDHDSIPSITIDDYQSVFVIQVSSASGEFLFPYATEALLQLENKNLFERSTGQIRQMDGLPERTRWVKCIPGEEENFEISNKFAGLNINFYLNKAQKTGLFLDQRTNLNYLSEILQRMSARVDTEDNAKNMLDICSYAGAWSSMGAKKGLTHFTLIDQDAFALKLAEKNILRNVKKENVDKIKINSLHGDMFEHLSVLSKQNKKFDVVIADPPAFAKSSKHIIEAKRAYIRLIKLAASLTEENGYLIVCSCSRHINDELFYECVIQGLEQGNQSQWVLVHKGEQSPCHTRLMQAELSDYLKCYFLQRR